MFLLRKILISETGSEIILKSGIEVFATTQGLICADSFWGDTIINVDSKVDYLENFEKTNVRGGRRLEYVSAYYCFDALNSLKRFIFYVEDYDLNKLEGYILFIKRSVKHENIKTNGTLLFNLYPHEIVIELKNSQYIKIDEAYITIEGGKLNLIK